ncbi:cell division protein FtsA [Bisgaardia hudsonensis]|uniref:Cell division protein FtsA n=1 Tax=Bisgaardia hudsonensis TaxID=109472 RepID=A0A4R2N055_9PAST|nr:cell division protein FtsA [Bisgaardia hudsonensis]QLB13360.1 cell division protein FtsA [Bisgaardia hudsonensis]TCP12761.1 cell division protein FtsA [Bisgaardia hudsonensis]
MAKDENIVVGLEIGTSKVVAVVGELLPDGVVNILGAASCPAKGIDKGSITDLSAVVTSIQRAIDSAESVADSQILSVTLAITGEHIQSLNESGFVPISDGEVTQDEIDAAMHTASSVRMGDGLSLLHVIPQEYAVDKQVNIKDPLGLQGVRLKAQAHLIACHQDWLNNLKKAVERCKLKVNKIVYSGYASAEAVLTEDEKELGVCLIDFGAGTMDIVVYTDGAIRFSKVIPYAGNYITDDIAKACATSRAGAESIKVTYGSAVNPPSTQPEKKIEVASIGGRPPRLLTKEQLSLVTSIRYKDLLNVVKSELAQLHDELENKQMKFELIAGVVITGGGAQIEDLKECASEVFGTQVRIASPLNITGLTDYVNKPQYSTVVGLLHVNHNHLDEVDSGSYSSSNGISQNPILSGIKKFLNKVRSEF